jgi:hypothetical protein
LNINLSEALEINWYGYYLTKLEEIYKVLKYADAFWKDMDNYIKNYEDTNKYIKNIATYFITLKKYYRSNLSLGDFYEEFIKIDPKPFHKYFLNEGEIKAGRLGYSYKDDIVYPVEASHINGEFNRHLNVLMCNPEKVEYGKKFPTINDNCIEYFSLLEGDNKDLDKINYWKQIPSSIHISLFIDENDFPASNKYLLNEWKNFDPDVNMDDDREFCNDMLAMKQWVIPPKAYVQLKVGPFIGVSVTEHRSKIFFKWETEKNGYMSSYLDIGTKNTFIDIELKTDVTETTKLFLEEPDRRTMQSIENNMHVYLRILMLSIIRDFWVPDKREQIFYTVKRKNLIKNKESSNKFTIVYLPRRIYTRKINLNNAIKNLDISKRAKHHVRSHIRKVNPSSAQKQLAEYDGVNLPEGYTYVRGHYKGDINKHKIYRSRSAIDYVNEHSPKNDALSPDMPEWFIFEEEVKTLYESFGYKIIFKAAIGVGEGGVDIKARKKVNNKYEDIIIQCKKSKNPIGGNIVRELMGTLEDFKDDVVPLKGAVYTTSYFEPEAKRLAAKHGIQLVDGDDFAKISNKELNKI